MLDDPSMDPKGISKSGQLWGANSSNSEFGTRKQSESVLSKSSKNERQKPNNFKGRNSDGRYTNRSRELVSRRETDSEVKVGKDHGSHRKKKTEVNIDHLVNFTYSSRDDWLPGDDHSRSRIGRVRTISKSSTKSIYNKEQYLQANCQFVVASGPSYEVYSTDPDMLVDWDNIEQIRTKGHELPNCPICLYPPLGAKITRCGHVYCWPCILHYLALSDKTWRKCPICFESVHKCDLKSVSNTAYHQHRANDMIEMILMKRERQTLIPHPVGSPVGQSFPPNVEDLSTASVYSKLLNATHDQVIQLIIEPERAELQAKLLEEGDSPEACFVREALDLLDRREENVRSRLGIVTPQDLIKDDGKVISTASVSETLKPITYSSAFDESIDIEGHDKERVVLNNNPRPNKSMECKLGPKPKDCFYFYQASDGQHVYLHSLNVRMLIAQYGSLELCPPTISARIIEVQTETMNSELRNKLRYLAHLPVTCQYDVVELILKDPIVSTEIYMDFKDEIDKRRKKRSKKAIFEKRHERRVLMNEKRTMNQLTGMASRQINTQPVANEDSPKALIEIDSAEPNTSQHAGPSFAQMLLSVRKDAPVNSKVNLGVGNTPITCIPEVRPDPDSDPEPVDWVPAPSWENFISDAVTAALDKVELGPKRKGRKGKKSIVLFDSGSNRPNM